MTINMRSGRALCFPLGSPETDVSHESILGAELSKVFPSATRLASSAHADITSGCGGNMY
jgi:hypothetical protein